MEAEKQDANPPKIEFECKVPYNKCIITLCRKYVNDYNVYVREPKPYVFNISIECEKGHRKFGYWKTIEFNENTGHLLFGGFNHEGLEIDLHDVIPSEMYSIDLAPEESRKLHEWLCTFAELRDTVLAATRGAQVWRANKARQLNIAQVHNYLTTEWQAMESKMRSMQSKILMLEQRIEGKMSQGTQARNFYHIGFDALPDK